MIASVVPELVDSKPGQINSQKHPYFKTLIMMTEQNLPGIFKFRDVLEAGGNNEKKQLEDLQKKIHFDDPINVQFTSGTTGLPKATTLSHHSIVNNCISNGVAFGHFTDAHRLCLSVPLFHSAGCVAGSAASVIAGFGVVVPSQSFDAEAALLALQEEKCTGYCGIPAMYIDMLNHPNFSKFHYPDLRYAIMGAAACPPEVIKQVEEKMNCSVVIVYGATELTCVISKQDKDAPLNEKMDNVGKVFGHVEVKLVDANDETVPFGTPGEICARGYQIMKRYWGDEDKTKESIKDGWYYTGDIGILQEDGTLQIVARKKDMIIRGGENIFPAEIENFFLTHPKILDVHVIGVSDARMGEEVCAWIKLKPNEKLSETEVREFCEGQVAYFKIPRYIRFVDDFPKSSVGKVLKFVMREQMEKILNEERQANISQN